jgi:hypothetical protein
MKSFSLSNLREVGAERFECSAMMRDVPPNRSHSVADDGSKDYSGVPLRRKLGIKEGHRVVALGAPDNLGALLGDLPPGVRVGTRLATDTDVIVLFVTKLGDLERRLERAAEKLDPAGGLWVAYPKKSSGMTTDLTFAEVQAAGLAAGLVDNKSCAIDATWSGVRFVYRVRDRART